jgi:hypothetical protein
MEKVRKAEVPPPSNFNRRVTPELDAISLKALARDVADRYQTAAQLAADLDSLIEGYRFDPKELRQFMRQLFRKEYAKELEDTQMSLETEPGLSMSMTIGDSRMPTSPPTQLGTQLGTPTEPRMPPPPQITREPEVVDPTTPPPDPEEKPKGFWGSLFKKRR